MPLPLIGGQVPFGDFVVEMLQKISPIGVGEARLENESAASVVKIRRHWGLLY